MIHYGRTCSLPYRPLTWAFFELLFILDYHDYLGGTIILNFSVKPSVEDNF